MKAPPLHTFFDTLATGVSLSPGKAAVMDSEGRSVSYGNLARQVESMAAWLHSRGVRRWNRVAVFLPKSIEEVVALFAVARLGAVFVCINTKSSLAQFEHIVADAGPRWVFAPARRLAELRSSPAMKGRGLVVVPFIRPGEAAADTLSAPAEIVSWNDIPPCGEGDWPASLDQDVAALLYTSGSTGLAKGVMITNRNFMDAARRMADYLRARAEDRVLSLLPMSAPWGGLQFGLTFMSGGSIALQNVAFPFEIARSIRRWTITGLAAMPPTWVQLVDHLMSVGEDLPELRYVTSSGGVIPERILDAMPRVFPRAEIFLTYGLTEAFRSTVVPSDWFSRKRGSLGRPCTNVDVYVVDEQGKLCGPGERGELVHRGSLVTRGYWNNPAATAEAYQPRGELAALLPGEQVHYSGDMVERDADGFLWFFGRKDFLIKSGGFRVSPEEVETIATESGSVRHAMAFGRPAELAGHAVILVIEASDPAAFSGAEIAAHCQRRMPSYMVPAEIILWPGSLPRTGTGKLDRERVLQDYTEGRLAGCQLAGVNLSSELWAIP